MCDGRGLGVTVKSWSVLRNAIAPAVVPSLSKTQLGTRAPMP